MSPVDYDVIIVGAGFAGVNLAYNLAKEGKEVLMVEAGPPMPRSREDYIENFWLNTFKSPSAPYPPNDNAGLDIKEAPGRTNAPRATIQDVTITANGTRMKPERNRQTYLTYDEEEEVDYMQSPFASTYERVAGGTGNHWMGTCLRMADVDFRLLDEYRVGKNWPKDIGAQELAEDYAQAEARIGVSADADEQRRYTNAYFPNGYEYPMPALSRSLVDRRIADNVDGHALTQDNKTAARVTGTPAGRNARPYAGRRACHGNTNCTPLCPIQAKYDPTVTLSFALDTGRVHVMYMTVVTRVLLGNGSKVVGLHYKQYTDTGVPADSGVTGEGTLGNEDTIFVLAANAIENAKLVLNSPGVASRNDLVGRNLMDHPVVLGWGIMPMDEDPVYGYRGPLSTAGLENLRDGAFRSERAAWRIEIGNEGWNWPTGGPFTSAADYIDGTNISQTNPDENIHLGSAFVSKANSILTREFRMSFLVEQLPQVDNQVLLADSYVDNLGIRRPKIRYRIDEYTAKGFESAREATATMMNLLGVDKSLQFVSIGSTAQPRVEYNGTLYNYRGAGHLCGTHIMSDDPNDGVVDSYQKSWEHDNLYLVGCGSHPTVGTQNPTLTMVAMVFRTTRHILGRI